MADQDLGAKWRHRLQTETIDGSNLYNCKTVTIVDKIAWQVRYFIEVAFKQSDPAKRAGWERQLAMAQRIQALILSDIPDGKIASALLKEMAASHDPTYGTGWLDLEMTLQWYLDLVR